MPDTIFALASGAGLCAVSVVRVSGPDARQALRSICRAAPAPRHAALRQIRHPVTGGLLDRCLVLTFSGPHSFTGEDGFELHIHGGRAVAAGVLEALGSIPRCRLAEPGEFTRRAFLNGKLDLTEAEGLVDLIEANTAAQRDQALSQVGGHLRDRAQNWRQVVLELQARAEAEIDFSDEGDVPQDVTRGLLTGIKALIEQMQAALADGRRGEILREGFTVVLAGAPNAGKSSLMNVLAQRDVAIVSSIPGTTRDLIEVHLDLDGLPVTLVDTAGLREAGDEIEQEGIRRTHARARAADLVLWLCAPEDTNEQEPLHDASVLRILSKADLRIIESPPEQGHRLSAATGEGVDDLLRMIIEQARQALRPEDPPLLVRERHRQAIIEAAVALGRISDLTPLEVAAEELRIAARALGCIIGLVGPEDVLGEIFSRFCIGK